MFRQTGGQIAEIGFQRGDPVILLLGKPALSGAKIYG